MPLLGTTGNISGFEQATASKNIVIGGNSTAAGYIELLEDTDNGSNKVTITAPQSIASDKTITLQDVTGTVYVTGGTDVAVADGGTGVSAASITAFNNITGYTAAGATGTTSTNLVFSTSPTLVTPVLGVAAATSISFGNEALSTYDEGTWTPTIEATTPGTPTYSTQGGRYIKVGKIVNCSGRITLTGLASTGSAGNISIGGLPFTTVNSASGANAVTPSFMHNWATPSVWCGLMAQNGTTCTLWVLGANNTRVTVTLLGDTASLYFSITYEAAT
jgi:hypothetical protein